MELSEYIHFGAGPAKIPEEVLRRAQAEFLNYAGTHISINELSHRSPEFKHLMNSAIQKARKLLNVPDNYKILFMHGGGAGQTDTVPLNLIGKTGKADYIVTGTWSDKALKVAEKYGKINPVLPKMKKYETIPDPSTWNLDPNASYVYYCANETAEGVEFQYIPETNGVPLVADMSSNIFSRPIDISKFGVIFGCAQKNIGPAGVTIVIVRDDLIGNALPYTPLILDYATTSEYNSMYNTPPCFAIYIIDLVFDWVMENGGVEEMERRAIGKSNLLYDLIDSSNGFYVNSVDKKCRSRMNITFRIKNGDDILESKFLTEAHAAGLLELKGYTSVGGIRASVYNAILPRHVRVLEKFLLEFMDKNK